MCLIKFYFFLNVRYSLHARTGNRPDKYNMSYQDGLGWLAGSVKIKHNVWKCCFALFERIRRNSPDRFLSSEPTDSDPTSMVKGNKTLGISFSFSYQENRSSDIKLKPLNSKSNLMQIVYLFRRDSSSDIRELQSS